jgi:hypothetical protein
VKAAAGSIPYLIVFFLQFSSCHYDFSGFPLVVQQLSCSLFFTGFFVAAAAMLSHVPSFLCTVTFKAVSNPMLPLCSSCHCVSYSMFTVYSSCCATAHTCIQNQIEKSK